MSSYLTLRDLGFVKEIAFQISLDKRDERLGIIICVIFSIIGAFFLALPPLGGTDLKTTIMFYSLGGCFILGTAYSIYKTCMHSLETYRKMRKPLTSDEYQKISSTSASITEDNQIAIRLKQLLEKKGIPTPDKDPV